MDWTYWLAGAIGLAFITGVLVVAALRDRKRGEEVVSDLPERTADSGPEVTSHDPERRG